jgi:hypothetical protein
MQKCRFFVKWAGKVGLVWSLGVELAVSHHLQVRCSKLGVRAQGRLFYEQVLEFRRFRHIPGSFHLNHLAPAAFVGVTGKLQATYR